MSNIFQKLNLKDQTVIVVINAPTSFESELAELENVIVRRSLDEVEAVVFSLAFVTRQEEVDALAAAVAGKAKGDALVWFAYPKGSSKKYRCDFNRDTGWDVLSTLGFEGVRQISIDEDWSTLRFRRVEFISKLTRVQKKEGQNTDGLQRPLQPMPEFVAQTLEGRGLMAAYRSRPPYQQNDYLGWINAAKREKTRNKRLQQMLDELAGGDCYMNMPYQAQKKLA